MVIAVLADIVGSRRLVERSAAQRTFDDTIARVEGDFPLALEPLRPTVGDEQQGLYPSLDAALAGILLLQLALPDGLEFRYGIGVGAVGTIDTASGAISDGSGWWAARAAIETAHARQSRAPYTARAWVVAAPEEDERVQQTVRLANAHLLTRDELVAGLSDRQRRLVYGRCLGTTQRELARVEGIGQPAVSQALAASGGTTLVEAFALLTAEAVR